MTNISPSPEVNAAFNRASGTPIIIAHRGASGERPEHTLAAYELAIDQGADYIEPDLVLTKDGVLVARHENEIGGTTNVADHPEFALRKTAKIIDGEKYTGWFTEDFTLAELKTLRARERLPQLRPENTRYDDLYEIPTFEEILALVKNRKTRRGGRVGVYTETKHPSYFTEIGLPHEQPLLELLTSYGFASDADPVFIQSFEAENLKQLRGKTSIRLIQLVSDGGSLPDDPAVIYADLISPDGLMVVAGYADGIGVAKSLLISSETPFNLNAGQRLVASAHKQGLVVHAWTFRRENYFLPAAFKLSDNPAVTGGLKDEIAAYLATGIDGIFTDNPKEAHIAVTNQQKN